MEKRVKNHKMHVAEDKRCSGTPLLSESPDTKLEQNAAAV